jgi:hypothetical protein
LHRRWLASQVPAKEPGQLAGVIVLAVNEDPSRHHERQSPRDDSPGSISHRRHGKDVRVHDRRLASAGWRGNLIGPASLGQKLLEKAHLPGKGSRAIVSCSEELAEVLEDE